jgi:two-component system, NarL family, nitrate/nitrite response regulator NarL
MESQQTIDESFISGVVLYSSMLETFVQSLCPRDLSGPFPYRTKQERALRMETQHLHRSGTLAGTEVGFDNSKPKTRILIVDDHKLFRESLSRLLQYSGDFEVVGECGNLLEAISVLSAGSTDVVLLDYDLGAEQGKDLLLEIKQKQVGAKVLVVTVGLSARATLYLLNEGVSGIFLKHKNLDQLISAIRRVAEGELWMDSGMLRTLIAGRTTPIDEARHARQLTPRQSQVIRGVLDGLTNKEIAPTLSASETLVKDTMQKLFRKAGVRTRSQLARVAIEKHADDWLKIS